MNAAGEHALRGRRERDLVRLPSVRRMVDVLDARCREESWTRVAVTSLDRFATLTETDDLEALLAQAQRNPKVARRALDAFAAKLQGHTQSQVADLALGAKLWFTFNGVALATWRRLPGEAWTAPLGETSTTDRLLLLALVGSGLRRAELLRLRVRDVGALDATGELVPDLDADPIAVRYIDARSRRERITFLRDRGREALLADIASRVALGETLHGDAPLVANAAGGPATRVTIARAQRLNASLIDACNHTNVELCRTTGEFFRTWGMPGSRFVPHPQTDDSQVAEAVEVAL